MEERELEKYEERLKSELEYWEEACKVYPKAKVPKTQVIGIKGELEKIKQLKNQINK